MGEEEIATALSTATHLIPGEDQEPFHWAQPYADDAAASLAYALRTLRSGDPRDAACAAQRGYDTVDYFVTHTLGLDDPAVAIHPLVQGELSKQDLDLQTLEVSEESAELLAELRARAKCDAIDFLSKAAPDG